MNAQRIWGAAIATIVVTAGVGILAPALRASRIDPLQYGCHFVEVQCDGSVARRGEPTRVTLGRGGDRVRLIAIA